MSASPSIVDAAMRLPLERYGLQLVEDPERRETQSLSCPEPASPPALSAFHWSLLTGFVVLELAYLHAVVVLAHWAVQRVIGS